MHALGLCIYGIVAHGGGDGVHVAQHVLAHYNYGQARGGNVLLRTGIYKGELGYVYGFAHYAAGHIGDQGHVSGIGNIIPAGAVYGVVEADMHIVRLGIELQLFLAGNAGEANVLTGPGDVYLAVFFGFLGGLAGEIAGNNIVGLVVLVHQVKRNHRKLKRRAALHEYYLVVIGDVHYLAHLGFGLNDYVVVSLGAVTHFHYAHAAAFVVEHVVPCAFKHLYRKHRGAGREVIDPVVNHIFSP